MNVNSCQHEANTLKYFAAQLNDGELAEAQAHIADCFECNHILAELTKTMLLEETEEEKTFLDAYTKTSEEKARNLVKELLKKEAKADIPNNVLSFSTKTSNSKKNIFSIWVSSPLVLVASLAILLLVGTVAFLTSQNKPTTLDSEIAQSLTSLKEINKRGRPTIFRIDGFDYAPPKTRGDSAIEMEQKLTYLERLLESKTMIEPSLENLNLLANVLITSGKYNQAIKEIEKALELKPNDSELLTNLAVAYAAKEDYQNALLAINQALRTNKNYLPAIFNRALIYKELKQYNEARSDWEKYVTLDPNSSWANEVKEYLNKFN